MRNLILVLALGVVMLVSSPAMAVLTLAGNWNGGDPPADAPATWEETDFNYMNRLPPPDPVVNDYWLNWSG